MILTTKELNLDITFEALQSLGFDENMYYVYESDRLVVTYFTKEYVQFEYSTGSEYKVLSASHLRDIPDIIKTFIKDCKLSNKLKHEK